MSNFTIRENRRISKVVRAACSLSGKPYPIEFVSGFQAPAVSGKTFYHTNKSGDIIWYPNAYRRRFGRPIYHKSTLQIEVGIGWVLENVFQNNSEKSRL